ncbi:Heme exporter protein D cytochrome c-type biogenesis protein CcmD [Cupriavidus taiwanensis]|uniref:heme exporter protein CcmD n=1 Tax=Cupriavidus taiwanensis TaxID=164546 RepID=UPI000E103DA0|nr:heme exporter protein CcmD [Cupriavidus taiwanensis]ULX51105.1 heme exporter protein CcmD [Cupriavidus taiwanensis]SPA42141.1 Heme exporter protein D cytochrome c-type biogenesis protein CcmD [Cupriavidus taiwanensis]
MTLASMLPALLTDGRHGIFIAGAFGVSALLLGLELALLARRSRATRRQRDREAER